MTHRNIALRHNRKCLYSEAAYFIGVFLLALGTAFAEKGNLGMSMVVAPAYLIHLKVSEFLPFFSFGMAEYCFQALLLVILSMMFRKVKFSYIFSFITALFYGFTLDGIMKIVSLIPEPGMGLRIVFFAAGLLLCAGGVSFLFHTYISPEAYELFVKEIAAARGYNINKCKMVYDCVSCVLGIILSFLFFGFGKFRGVNIGTIIAALLNGFLISRFSRALEYIWEFRDGLRFRRFFEKS